MFVRGNSPKRSIGLALVFLATLTRVSNGSPTPVPIDHAVPRLCDAIGESVEECVDKGVGDTYVPLKTPKFLLYYKNSTIEGNTRHYYVELPRDAGWIQKQQLVFPNVPWKILIHGFVNNASSNFPVNVRNAYVERMRVNKDITYNILVVDWGESACASTPNQTPHINTISIGKTLADFLVLLHTNGLMDVTQDVHLIGHSVGGHIAGQAGRHVLASLGKSVHRITALDPAGSAFWSWKLIPDLILPMQRLHHGDAQFVDVYHTSSFFGCKKKLGTADFWINGGESQPSCVPEFLSHLIKDYLQICSHNYVTTLFANSIRDNSTQACRCPSYRTYMWKTCNCTETAMVGEFIETTASGRYYVNTPRDDKAVGSFLQSWQNFNLNTLMQQFRDMICPEVNGNSTIYHDD